MRLFGPLAFTCVLLLAPAHDPDDLWPMDEGRFWRFRSATESAGERRIIVRATLKLRRGAHEEQVHELLDDRGDDWRYEYFAFRTEGRPGIYRLPNARLGGERGANLSDPPRPLLSGPEATTWAWTETWGVQTDVNGSMPPLEDLTLSFTGRAKEGTVTVPAGAFQSLHVTLEGQGRFHGAHRYEYWFVRGVGPVKIIEDAETWELIEHGAGRQGERNMKGWELHVRAEGDDYRFGLLQGTNRLKTPEEIEAALTIRGLKALGKALERLAVDEEVILVAPPEWEIGKQGAVHRQRLREPLLLEGQRLALRMHTGC